jgi:AcrR family transcriptional regulator
MSLSYDYYPAVLYALNEISQGRTLTDACDRANIAVPVFDRYVKNDAELQAMYEEAIQRGNDAMADALVNIDNHKIHGQSDAKMAKVISDNIKWVLGKRDSKRFGEKIEVKHEITMDRAIVSALEAARGRVPVIDAEYTVDVTPALPAPEDDELMRELLS